MKKPVIFLFVIILFSVNNTHGQGYNNPVIPGFYPDPSVCRVGNDYYLVTSTFEYFPGVPVFHSKDLINWEQIGHCLTRKSQLPLDNCPPSWGIYAPTIRHHNGLFYMTTTNVGYGGNFYVTATDPAKEWSEPIYVKQGGIDPTIFFDDDDRAYYLTQGSEIMMSEIDITNGDLLTSPRAIWGGTGGRYPEAPHIYKKDGCYYLLIAEGGTEFGHKVTIARSKNIWGPYENNPANPILTHINQNAQSNPIQGTGHGDLIEAHDGSWWMVHLAFRNRNSHHILGRETFLVPVQWNKNAWPVVNGNGTVNLKMDCKTLPQVPIKPAPARHDFNMEKLPLEWTYLRNPDERNYVLLPEKGILRLKGSAESIDGLGSPTFIARRQQHFDFSATAAIKNCAISNGRGGLSVYMNNTSHYDLYVIESKNKYNVELRCKLGKVDYVVKRVQLDKNKNIRLKIEGNADEYKFSYSTEGSNFTLLAALDTKYLSSETAGGFTGVFIALFAEGVSTVIDFDYFGYLSSDNL